MNPPSSLSGPLGQRPPPPFHDLLLCTSFKLLLLFTPPFISQTGCLRDPVRNKFGNSGLKHRNMTGRELPVLSAAPKVEPSFSHISCFDNIWIHLIFHSWCRAAQNTTRSRNVKKMSKALPTPEQLPTLSENEKWSTLLLEEDWHFCSIILILTDNLRLYLCHIYAQFKAPVNSTQARTFLRQLFPNMNQKKRCKCGNPAYVGLSFCPQKRSSIKVRLRCTGVGCYL